MTQPWDGYDAPEAAISHCQDRQQGNILLLSRLLVVAIPCCNFVPLSMLAPPWASSSYSMLSGLECNLHYSKQVQQQIEGCCFAAFANGAGPT